VAYNIKKTNTILRVSYARTLESPFNENLILSSIGCGNAVLNPLLLCSSSATKSFERWLSQRIPRWPRAGFRKVPGLFRRVDLEVHAQRLRLQRAWQHADHLPIEWHNSKIPGYAGRVSVPELHGFSALMVFSSVAARFFPPQIAGAGATVERRALPSASTTTNVSTRQPTSNTNRGNAVPGWASTGGMTLDL